MDDNMFFTPCCGRRTNDTIVATEWGIYASPNPLDDPHWWENTVKILESEIQALKNK